MQALKRPDRAQTRFSVRSTSTSKEECTVRINRTGERPSSRNRNQKDEIKHRERPEVHQPGAARVGRRFRRPPDGVTDIPGRISFISPNALSITGPGRAAKSEKRYSRIGHTFGNPQTKCLQPT